MKQKYQPKNDDSNLDWSAYYKAKRAELTEEQQKTLDEMYWRTAGIHSLGEEGRAELILKLISWMKR